MCWCNFAFLGGLCSGYLLGFYLGTFCHVSYGVNQFCIFSGSKVVVGKVTLWVFLFFEVFEFMLWLCQLGVLGVWWL